MSLTKWVPYEDLNQTMRKMPIIIQGSSKIKEMHTMSEGSEVMGDREYLYELAMILDSADTTQRHGETPHIRIDHMTAKDIAERLCLIANRMTTMVH